MNDPGMKDVCESIMRAVVDLREMMRTVDDGRKVDFERIIGTLLAEPCCHCACAATKRTKEERRFEA